MLCGILVVVALLGLLGTAPSAYAADCRLQIIDHENTVLKTFTVEAGESDCRREFGKRNGLLLASEKVESQRDALILSFLNAFPAPESETGRSNTVQFMLNNDITYNSATKKLHILGVHVDFSHPLKDSPILEDSQTVDGMTLRAEYVSTFMMDGEKCCFRATAEFEFEGYLRELLARSGGGAVAELTVVDRAEPQEMLLVVQCTSDEGDKFVKLPRVAWKEIGKLFAHSSVVRIERERGENYILLSAACCNVVGVTEASQLEEQLKVLLREDDNWSFDGLSDDHFLLYTMGPIAALHHHDTLGGSHGERLLAVASELAKEDENSSDDSSNDKSLSDDFWDFWAYDFSPTAMEGKAHHHQRKAHRHKRRAGRRLGRRGRHGHRAHRGRRGR